MAGRDVAEDAFSANGSQICGAEVWGAVGGLKAAAQASEQEERQEDFS